MGKYFSVARATALLVGAMAMSVSVLAASSSVPTEFSSIVDNMSQQKTFQADVTQVNRVAGVGNETFTGKVYIEYGSRAFWGYTQPSVQVYLIEEDNVIYYDELLEQVYITSKDKLQGDLLLGLMSDVNSLVKDFTVSKIQGTQGGFNLAPKKTTSTIKNVKILTNNGVIETVKSYDHKGNIIEMTFSKVVLGKKISNDKFEIKYPKDVQVIRR